MTVANKVLSGSLLMLSAQMARRGFDFLTMLVLARLLTPADFGLVALAGTTILVFMAVTDVQFSDALIQMKDPKPEHYNAAFTLSLLRSVAIVTAIILISWPISTIYGDPRLQTVLIALSFAPALRGLASPRMAEYARKLDFLPESINEISSKAVAFALSATMASLTQSYWAIVLGQVSAPLMYMTLSYVRAPFSPRFSLTAWRDLLRFSGWISLQNTANVINFYVDRFLIGSRLGQVTLGIYVVGGDWAALPTQTLQAPLSKVLFSGLSRKSADAEGLRTAYRKAQQGAGALLVPAGLGMAVTAKYLIPVALGPAWQETIPIIQILAPIFAFQSITAPAQALAMAKGDTRSLFWRDAVNFAVRLPLIIVGVWFWGIFGVLTARVLAGLNITFMSFALVGRLSGIRVIEQILAMWRSFFAGASMVVSVLLLQAYLERCGCIGNGKILIASIAMGVISYPLFHIIAWLISKRPDGPETQAIRLATRIVSKRRNTI